MTSANNGIMHLTSVRPVGATLEHILSILRNKGITIFAVVDHSGEAAKAGIEMHDTKLVIFGNPKAGTPLMLAVPDIALELPLKILIAEDPNGTTRVSYNDPAYLQSRFGLAPELMMNILVIEQLAKAIVI
jgi:uncharacterized protein (DUF302 family)